MATTTRLTCFLRTAVYSLSTSLTPTRTTFALPLPFASAADVVLRSVREINCATRNRDGDARVSVIKMEQLGGGADESPPGARVELVVTRPRKSTERDILLMTGRGGDASCELQKKGC